MSSQTRQWIASLTCTLCVAMTGSSFTWIAPLMVILVSADSPIPMTTYDSSWISSCIGISAAFATIPAGLLADRCGRKAMMMSIVPLSLISWTLMASTRTIYVLYLVRVLQGFALATCFTAAPMYLAEVAEPSIRGKLSGQFQTFWYLGCLYAYSLGPFLSYNNFIYACAAVNVVVLVLFCFVPESPYYLLIRNRDEEAKKALGWLRGDSDVTTEFQSIKKCVSEEMERKGGWRDLFATKKDRKGFLLVQVLCIVKYCGGMSAIVIYATQMFDEEFREVMESHYMTIILASILVTTTFCASMITDRIGRKPLLIFSSSGGAICHLTVSIINYLDINTAVDVSSIKWLSYVAIIGFCIISNIGIGPLMQTIQAEYFPSNTRAIAGGITNVIASIGGFINIKQYQILNDAYGMYMNYFIFFLVSVMGTILFSTSIKETAGKSLAEIQTTFEEKKDEKQPA